MLAGVHDHHLKEYGTCSAVNEIVRREAQTEVLHLGLRRITQIREVHHVTSSRQREDLTPDGHTVQLVLREVLEPTCARAT